MLIAAPSGCCTGGMFSSGIHALGPFGAGEVTARVAPSTVALFRIVVDVHALQADGSAGSTVGINRGKSEFMLIHTTRKHDSQMWESAQLVKLSPRFACPFCRRRDNVLSDLRTVRWGEIGSNDSGAQRLNRSSRFQRRNLPALDQPALDGLFDRDGMQLGLCGSAPPVHIVHAKWLERRGQHNLLAQAWPWMPARWRLLFRGAGSGIHGACVTVAARDSECLLLGMPHGLLPMLPPQFPAQLSLQRR